MSEVQNNFLVEFPEHESFLKPFLFGFDISYAEKKRLNNTIVFAYLLKPENHMRESFGIDKEVLLVYSPYDELQPRAIQAVNMLFDVFPFKNRIDMVS